jgi:hypothetical protein
VLAIAVLLSVSTDVWVLVRKTRDVRAISEKLLLRRGITTVGYWFVNVRSKRSPHGYKHLKRSSGRSWKANTHAQLVLPLVVLGILFVDPLLRVVFPLLEVVDLEWDELLHQNPDGFLHVRLGHD